MTAPLSAREQVLSRLHGTVGLQGSNEACFAERGRVEAALRLAEEGLLRCWVEELPRSGGEVLVCRLAANPPRRLPPGQSSGRGAA